ncbi:MAG: hypothetical protein KKE23_00850 [Nanoarchaeota archaeon]|nr:hypothetical protein [Nanoarchaeota archaeon]
MANPNNQTPPKQTKIPVRTAVKNVSLELKRNAFSTLFHMFSRADLYGEVAEVRALLSNERARIIHTIKDSHPESVYALTKLLGRDFKSVRKDITLLQHFGIVRLIRTTKKGQKRMSLKPILQLDNLQINIKF